MNKEVMKKPGILLLILILAITAFSCSGNAASQESLSGTEKNLPDRPKAMNEEVRRINLQTLSFNPPENFQDQSVNEFIIPTRLQGKRYDLDTTERVSAEHLNRSEATADLETCRRFYYKEFEAEKERLKNSDVLLAFPGTTSDFKIFIDEQTVVNGEYPALIIGKSLVVVKTGVNAESGYEMDAFVFDSQTNLFHLHYKTKEYNERIEARLKRMVGSLQLRTPEFTGEQKTTDDGYIRRCSGNATLEIPSDIVPQRKFVYERDAKNDSEPDAEMAKMILMSLVEPDDQEKLADITEETINYQTQMRSFYSGSIKDVKESPVKTKFYEGVIKKTRMLVNEGYPPEMVYQTITLLVKLKDSQERQLIIKAATRVENEQALETELAEWLEKFVPVGETDK